MTIYFTGSTFNQVIHDTIESMDDIVLEKGLFAAKSGDFERIFSVKPVIKEKHT